MPRPPGHGYYTNFPYKTTGIDATEEESVELMKLKKEALDVTGYSNEYDDETNTRSAAEMNSSVESDSPMKGSGSDSARILNQAVESPPKVQSFNELVY